MTMLPERMERVTIVTPDKHVKQAIEILYEHRVLHIIDHKRDRLDIGSPLEGSAKISELLVQARSLIHSLHIPHNSELVTTKRGDLSKLITKIHTEVTKLLSQENEHENAIAKASDEYKKYSSLAWLLINPTKLRASKHLAYLFGEIKQTEGLAAEISALTPRNYVELEGDGPGVLVLIEHEKEAAAKLILDKRGFTPADYAHILELDKPLTKHLAALHAEKTLAEKELAAIRKEIAALAKEHGAFLVAAEHILAADAKKMQAPLRCGVTKHSCFINGWVPTKNVKHLIEDLETHLSSEVYVEYHLVKEEEAPIKLENNTVVEPFEALLKLYTLPKYHEIDPSTIMFLSFPIFFGFMLGDIGYGLTTLILFALLRRIFKPGTQGRALSNILIFSAISSIVFGFVFGEFFGLETIGPIILHPLIHRATDMMTLLTVAVVVGVIHIILGFLIGYINELHYHGPWKAFCAKISWLILLAGVGLLAAGYSLHTPTIIAGWILVPISIILIYIGEGIKGLIEVPAIFSNIMSYSRLMAIGVASAALAIVVNNMAGGLFNTGTAGIIGGIFVLIFGHTINLALGIMGPFLHSLRLHYVEFFSKFYEGGGKPYKPFGVDETEATS